jgi:hypothetical protein
VIRARLAVYTFALAAAVWAGEPLILNTLWQERSLTTDEAARLTQKPEAETRATLRHLVEAGLTPTSAATAERSIAASVPVSGSPNVSIFSR